MLESKNIVVTGGAGLIGSEICKSIAKKSGNVIVADLDEARSKVLVSQLCEMGPKAIWVPLDITNKGSILNSIDQIAKELGPIHGLINNAYPRPQGFGKDFFDVEYNTLCSSLNMHLAGYFLVSQCVSAHMLELKTQGSIVNISSIYGVMAPRFEIYEGTSLTNGPEYAMIKAGVVQLTKYMAQRLKKFGINVNTVCPGGIFDNQPERFVQNYNSHCGQKGMLSPEDIVGEITHLLSSSARYVTGQTIVVDDGFSL